MLISHDHSFVFLKTRKTAGTSVELMLEPFCAPPGHVPREKTTVRRSRHGIIGSRRLTLGRWRRVHETLTPWYNHAPASRIRRGLGRRRFDRYLKIATVRNPFDRTLSLFFWTKHGAATRKLSFDEQRRSFNDWARAGDWADDSDIVTIGGRFVVDEAVRQERLADDLDRLAVRLGVELPIGDIPRAKNSRRSGRAYDTSEFYDPETADVVRRKMAWAFENLEYPETPQPSKACGT